MKRLVAYSLLACTITLHAAEGNNISIEYLAEQSDNTTLRTAELWCSMQPEQVQKNLLAVGLVPMLNVLEQYKQKDALPMCKVAIDNDRLQLAGMVRMTECWTKDPEKSADIAAHQEWKPWILALYVKSRYQEQDKKTIEKNVLADAEQELRRLGYTEAYFGAAPEEDALCEESGYTLVAHVKFINEATKIFRKDLSLFESNTAN